MKVLNYIELWISPCDPIRLIKFRHFKVDKYDLIAIGASTHEVSPGGWTLGGGHGAVSRMGGLGVDQVLEFTMVTADGSIVTVTENSNGEQK